MSQERLKSELAALEASLAALTPRPSTVDRDRLMFLAGRASGASARRRGPASWLWPLATAASLLLAAGLGTLAWLREVDQPVAYVPAAPTQDLLRTSAESTRWAADYLRLRNRVIDRGVDAVVDHSTGSAGRPSAEGPRIDRRALLKDLLRS